MWLILIPLLLIQSQEISSMKLKEPGNGVVKFTSLENSVQIAEMDEDNDPSVVLAEVEDVVGNLTINVILNDIYNIKANQDTNKNWNIILYDKIDFDALEQAHVILISLQDEQDRSTKLSLQINNIDNKQPQISAPQTTCNMKENTTITVQNTTCVYSVRDPDGLLSLLKFEILSKPNENLADLFVFDFQDRHEIPDNNYDQHDFYLFLKDGKILDFETVPSYILTFTAIDNAGHKSIPENLTILIKVVDIPDMPPIFTQFPSFNTSIKEHETESFQVEARDGDIEINNEINYSLFDTVSGNNFPETIATVNQATGLITMGPIIWDADHDQISIGVRAYEEPDHDWFTDRILMVNVIDVDDHVGEIKINGDSETKKITLHIDENFNSNLDLAISIKDVDKANNAIFKVSLDELNTDSNYTDAFIIIPDRGFMEADFSISVKNSKLLDYEDPIWRHIEFLVKSEGEVTPTNIDNYTIEILLNDLNDEIPQFEQNEYTVQINETVGIDYLIATVHATDRDAVDIDKVKHILFGTATNSLFSIESLTGVIKTKIPRSFDYERQEEVIVDVQAEDTSGNKNQTQLIIQVIDINDEDPVLSIPPIDKAIEENIGTGSILTIKATDEDKGAHMEFEILWNESYAVKNFAVVKQDIFDQYVKCIEVHTKRDPKTNKTIEGELVLVETVPGNTPDFEKFDTLYIKIIVTDLNTEYGIGKASAVISFPIKNINDNPPVFTDTTKILNRTVNDGDKKDVPIFGSIIANDPDYLDAIEYELTGLEEETKDWIKIDPKTGDLSVNISEIDCDVPKRFYINYTVLAKDSKFDTSLTISIYIIDRNDNSPEMEDIKVSIDEKSPTGKNVCELKATDLDRDAPYNEVAFYFGGNTILDVKQRFKFEKDKLIVSLENENTILDRDYGLQQYKFQIVLRDNPNNQGLQLSGQSNVEINLNDINDQTPRIKEGTEIVISEDVRKSAEISNKILAIDDDEGVHAHVYFEIFKILKTDEYYTNGQELVDQSMFGIYTDKNNASKQATLVVNQDLKGLFGHYILNISMYDFPENVRNQGYSPLYLNITKFNYNPPRFIFPEPDKSYYLAKSQNDLSALVQYNKDLLPNIQATDDQDGKYDIQFKIESGDPPDQEFLFTIDNSNTFGVSTAQIQLTTGSALKMKASTDYHINIVASIPGEKSAGEADYQSSINFILRQIDLEDDPTFDVSEVTFNFTEDVEGQSEFHELPRASFKGIEGLNFPIFYLLNKGDGSLFNVEPKKGVIRLQPNKTLDYEEQTNYTLTIHSSNSEEKTNPNPDKNSLLTVKINVTNINNKPPVFSQPAYFGQVVTKSQTKSQIIQVTATDRDYDAVIRYYINHTTFKFFGDDLPRDRRDLFEIQDRDGIILQNFEVQETMTGYISFEVYATDEGDCFTKILWILDPPTPRMHTVAVLVKIYIVAEKHKVTLKFDNELSQVISEMDNIKSIFDQVLGYKTTAEPPSADTSSTSAERTNAPMYFIDPKTNAPVEKDTIMELLNSIDVFMHLKQSLLNLGILLLSFENTDTSSNENVEATLKAWLIGVSVGLGSFCVIILTAFVLKTRSLKQRIDNLSIPKFGSQESGLNRVGVAAPTTNKHAVEGSNPVYVTNREVEENSDRESVMSGDSDLIGIEDSPEFDYTENSYNNPAFEKDA